MSLALATHGYIRRRPRVVYSGIDCPITVEVDPVTVAAELVVSDPVSLDVTVDTVASLDVTVDPHGTDAEVTVTDFSVTVEPCS